MLRRLNSMSGEDTQEFNIAGPSEFLVQVTVMFRQLRPPDTIEHLEFQGCYPSAFVARARCLAFPKP